MLKRTPLFDEHVKLHAKLTDFGGFEMPVQYAGIKQEHTAVRHTAGLFDVSHMGEFFIYGKGALDLIQALTINDASKLTPGKAQYTAMCYENGGIVDDLLVYMIEEDHYMMVVNASNIDKDYDWIQHNNPNNVTVVNKSDQFALIALQGPASAYILEKLTATNVHDIPFYSFVKGTIAAQPDIIISATGYTGEKGFELYIDTAKADAAIIWESLLENGKKDGLTPAGLGARDTLRLEMGYALYGNDITKDTTPLEARMNWLTKLDKEYFIGQEALLKQKEEGIRRKLVGFEMLEPRSVPRAGYTISDQNEIDIGTVTSGTQSITLDKGIGMGYIKIGSAGENEKVYINIRKKRAGAVIVKPPFLTK